MGVYVCHFGGREVKETMGEVGMHLHHVFALPTRVFVSVRVLLDPFCFLYLYISLSLYGLGWVGGSKMYIIFWRYQGGSWVSLYVLFFFLCYLEA